MIDKTDILKLVVQNKKSNLKNHWKDSQSYNTTKYSGEIKPHEILLWRSSHFLRGAYPIFYLSFDQSDKLIGIKIGKNPYHKFLDKILMVFFFGILLMAMILAKFKNPFIVIIPIAVIGILVFTLQSIIRKSETKYLIDELKETIKSIENLKNPQMAKNEQIKSEEIKEWSFSKIITRLIAYPFCLLVIWFCITGLIPEGKITQGIFGIIVALVYPISDILIILRKE
ncbi:hypothetical protein [Flavobacterium phycosphaerae]|uniref:hypothetical protein n=1 Tax=Flavobacterium phycosphaerae TaxID=2697515 RepID=UPI00138B1B4F|nr:hypothetical protein [Flavobacterium phycosphaerae]